MMKNSQISSSHTSDVSLYSFSKRRKLICRDDNGQKLVLYFSPQLENFYSSIYLSYSIARLSNQSDFKGLKQLLLGKSKCDCVLNFHRLDNNLYSCAMILCLIQYLSEKHPDIVFYAKNPEVVDNQIYAAICMRFTDNECLNESVAKNIMWKMFHSKHLPASRAEKYLLMQDLRGKSPEEVREIEDLVRSDVDLEVFGQWDMYLTIDPNTDKIARYELNPSVLSVQAVPSDLQSRHSITF